MTIKNTQTIAQYKIMKWISENFVDGSVEVQFTSGESATITDQVGGSMKLKYNADRDEVIEE